MDSFDSTLSSLISEPPGLTWRARSFIIQGGRVAMPLRDHFRPPASKRASWEGFHGQWPAMIVQQLNPVLPDGYTAEPRVHLGPYFEIDVTAFERAQPQTATAADGAGGGVVTASWSATQ